MHNRFVDKEINFLATAKAENQEITRHIDRRFHYVRQGQVANRHKLFWINNLDQVADIGTKAVTLAALEPIIKTIFVSVQD